MFKLIFGLLFFIIIGAIVLKAITPRKRKIPTVTPRRPMVNSSFKPTPSTPVNQQVSRPTPLPANKPTPVSRPSVRAATSSNSTIDDMLTSFSVCPTTSTGYTPMSEPKAKPPIRLGCASDYNNNTHNDDSRYETSSCRNYGGYSSSSDDSSSSSSFSSFD